MNGIAFRACHHAEGSTNELLKSMVLPEVEARIKAPARGTYSFERAATYDEAFAAFGFNSCLTRQEVFKIFTDVRQQNLKLLELQPFNHVSKSTRVDDFGKLQSDATDQVALKLQKDWPKSIVMTIRHHLKHVTKGWYNLEESSDDIYNKSKLRQFLRCLNMMMESAMRSLLTSAVTEYAAFLMKSCACDVAVEDCLKVTNKKEGTRKPLFAVDLSWHENALGYSSPLESFVKVPLERFDDLMRQTQSITRVERVVMRNLFWSYNPMMAAVHPSEAWVGALRKEVQASLEGSVDPLKKYLKTYEPYLEFLQLDVEAYITQAEEDFGGPPPGLSPDELTELNRPDLNVHALRTMAEDHIAEKRKVEASVPEVIDVGAYHVSTQNVRRLLADKHQEVATLLLDLVAKKTGDNATDASGEFQSIMDRLSIEPDSIEALTELREFIAQVPEKLIALRQVIEDAMKNYAVLEDICYKLPPSDFKLRWDLFSWPQRISEECFALEEKCIRLENKQQIEMEEAQAEFAETLKAYASEVDELGQFHDLKLVEAVAGKVAQIKANLAKADDDARLYNARESLFGKPVTQYDLLKDVAKKFEPYGAMWESIDMWLKSHKAWMEGPFSELNAELVEQETQTIFRALKKCEKKFETQQLEGCLSLTQTILKQVAAFVPHVPLIVALRQKGLRERHWKTISEKASKRVSPDETWTLTTVFDLKLEDNMELIQKQSEVAGKEYSIEASLEAMELGWEPVVLQIEPYKETGTGILRGIDEYMALLDEHITTTQAMSFSAFKGPFEERIESWNETLNVVSEMLDEWIAVQKNWLYLQPIFDSADINKQLPAEGKRFATVDKHWRATLSKAWSGKMPVVLFCNDPKLLEQFRESNNLLDMVQKGLSDFLETIRAGFSRFYFLSDGDLLEILSETKDPKMVQPHLRKCFEGIKSVDFSDALTISKMTSSEGEIVPFVKDVDPKGKNIEVWMVELNVAMCAGVRDHMIRAVRAYPDTVRTQWMLDWPGQVVLNASQVHWTSETETALSEKGNQGVYDYYEQIQQQLADMVLLIRRGLNSNQRTTVGALAVIDVHARDVMQAMGDAGVSSGTDFDWQSQMRFYWEGTDEEGDLWVKQVESKRSYGYEYLGNSFRLVITPLTDKCYLTLMGALQMILGGAPAGPAGTGKTETTKDLAKALAKQCVVFNCSDGLDYRAMGKFFKGLASAGAWACFDEFNRINIEVLSVIAQQIMTLQGCVQRGEPRSIFEDTDINVNPEFAVFITMNPGYAGRSALPDNLEALFRPVAMMVPDYALIGEIMFFAFGYMEGRKCGQKMVATFRLCSEQLSSQDHYDYGMRAVKTVITAAGNLKRAAPDANEEALLLRALQDVNIPKFLAHDLPLFDGILSDLFPGIVRPPFDYGPLITSLKTAIVSNGLQPVPIFIKKNIELYEMICVRHGLMVVGPTGGGKSENIRTLARALSALKQEGLDGLKYEKVDIHHLNPKSISMGQLYGMFDPNTHEWQDGILANLVRLCIKNTAADLQWVLFDGPVDAIWIENMNTVLDDNKKLCLTSGEIMSLSDEMTMMFEPEDLAVASPATVSRCGMIYMEPKSLGFDPMIMSWLERLPEAFGPDHKMTLLTLFDTYLGATCGVLRRIMVEPFPTVDGALLDSLLNLMDCEFHLFYPKEGRDPKTDEEVEQCATHMEAIFFFAFIWSVCCTVDAEGRQVMDVFVRQQMRMNSSKFQLPSEGLIFDYLYDTLKCEWVPWMDTVSPYEYDSSASFAELIIPTPDSIRYTYLLETLVLHDKHVIMTGPTGTGKTVNVNRHLQGGFNPLKYVPICLTFSAQTSANQVQDLLDSKFEKRRKGIFGPSAGKKYILFVDDLNMPLKEEYGAQPPIEILRQWFDSGGWYDRKALTFRNIIDVVFVCACGPPGGGRQSLSARFPRHFNTVGYTPMQDSSMQRIFQTILGNFLSSPGWEEEIKTLANGVVDATIEVYNTILRDLRPTPAKSHYQFNLRDISKVFQGVLMTLPSKFKTASSFIRLFVHENQRIFGDRLINAGDHEWFDDLILKCISTHCGEEHVAAVTYPLVIADFMVPGADPRIYEEVTDISQLQPTIEEYLNDYNAESKQPMPLVMFMDAIQHVARITRVLRQPKGNMLLLGVGGSGRQSLSRLSTFMAECKIFSIEITKGYGLSEWRESLKEILLFAGIKAQPAVFLFSDMQIVFEAMLEDINNVLNTGDVPNLYAVEDDETITTACKQDCIRKRLQPTKLNIFACYLSRVMANLHLILCFSPLGEAFRNRLRMFPSLVNCSTVDWFAEWPREALHSVATRLLTEEDLQLGDENAHLTSCVTFFKDAHVYVARRSEAFLAELGRHNYVTPTSYLELLATYKQVLALKRDEVGTLKNRLRVGLDKLIATAEQVEALQVKLTDMEPVLKKTQGEVEVMIVNIDADKKDAAETQTIVAAEEEAAQTKAAETKAIADDAQRDLDEALPALEEAVKCLNSLKKTDIDEVRTMGKPPAGVKLTMEGCCIMFGIKPEMEKNPDGMGKVPNYFKSAQKELLSLGGKLIDKMKEYDKDNIPAKIIKQIEPYIAMEAFTPAQVQKASKACTAMCMWCRAMHKYYTVSVMVEPKKKLLAEATAELEATMIKLQGAQSKLKEVMDKLERLEKEFNEANDKKQKLQHDVEECAARLQRAKKLIGGLGGERTRWTESCASLELSYAKLVGDALISAATIAYTGAFTPDFRKAMTTHWQASLEKLDVPHMEGCDIRQTLADPVAIRTWTICGLPSDSSSVENGIIMSKARRFPLLIDPQGQANRYIKNMGRDPSLAENGIEVTKLTEKNYLRTLENAVRFGRWVLLENILETLDASLEPLLLQQKFIQGGTEMIKLGDSTIPWNDSFKFFMTSNLPNPHYAPEVCVKVSLLNFAITPVGLEDQLLGVVVAEERPDMAEKKNSLVVANASMKKQLMDIESKILYMLSNSTGNILDDHELIETLASSKVTSTEITEKVTDAEVTEQEIDAYRERYRPVAFRATILYFSIVGLSVVDPMYQYSLQWFTTLFVAAIPKADKAETLELRLDVLNTFFTYYVYVNVCRSLFEKDKLLLSFLMTVKILDGSKEIDATEWRFLITGKTTQPVSVENPAPEGSAGGWIDGRMWSEVCAVSGAPTFEGFAQDFGAHLAAWRAYFDHVEPHTMALPDKWNECLNSFQKLCVLRCLRADKVTDGVMNYVIEKMGQRFIEPPPFNLANCYKDASNLTPIVFVLTKGSDPTKAFNLFCTEMKFNRKVQSLSLGQGQGPKATQMIEDASAGGKWVYLQNCHLFVSWLVVLEGLCDALSAEKTHRDFRLWLTSMPCAAFPVSILQNGVKMTMEPPKGLKANLKATYFKMTDAELLTTDQPVAYQKLLFALCFFHACCQERRKFGPLGWNVPYEFNETDLDISREQLVLFLNAYDTIPYRVLCFLTSYINYGGRVTDYIDIRTCDVIMKSFYRPETLDTDYPFEPSGTYRSIDPDPEHPHQSYMDYIETLPLTAGPAIFGMHENANISCAFTEAFGMFDTLVALESSGGGGGGGGGGVSREELIALEVTSITDKLELRGAFDVPGIQMQYPVVYDESMNTVLAQECIRYNKLVHVMQLTLPELAKALQGLVVMSGELEAMGNSIAVGQVPGAWEAKAYPSLKPLGPWTDDLMLRLDFIRDWIKDGIPVTFWISGFYFPQAFLTGSMQNYARSKQFPIDTIAFDHIMMDTSNSDDITTKPEDGVYIRGLFLEGARWDPDLRSLNDSRPKQLFSAAPIMHLSPVKDRVEPTGGIYRCPVYKELSRRGTLSTTGHSTNFVMWIEMPSNRADGLNNDGKVDQLEWAKGGVAMFCSLKF
jgi:dynein heavy chain